MARRAQPGTPAFKLNSKWWREKSGAHDGKRCHRLTNDDQDMSSSPALTPFRVSAGAGGSVATRRSKDMADDDKRRDTAGDEHAIERKPEFRVRAERARESAKREEHRKTEQMKADAQRKAESAKTEERRIAESRRREERKRAENRQESLRKNSERRTQNAKAAVERSVRDDNSAARRKTGMRPTVSPRSRTRDARSPRISGGAQRPPSRAPAASKVQQQEEHRLQRTTCVPCTTTNAQLQGKRRRGHRQARPRDREHQ